MGYILKGECPCGFSSKELFVGGGEMDVNYCAIPVACPKCARLWVENKGKSESRCSKCRSTAYYLHVPTNYTPSDIAAKIGDDYPWDVSEMPADDPDELDLDPLPPPDFSYRCPKCGELKMKLIKCGLWD